MREAVNGRGASMSFVPHPDTVRKIRQLSRMADYLRNQRNIAPTQGLRELYETQLIGKLDEIAAIENGPAVARLRKLAEAVKPGLFFVMAELDGAKA